jgi:predicted AAA+ superfamily ATPase
MERIQKDLILKDLEKKIVLLVGPRQSGKTWLAKNIAEGFPNSVYLNYDQKLDRDIMNAQSWLDSTDLLILDELHKMEDWKNYLKGVYDTKPDSMRILVTGSARLDIFDKLGDSLAGRYFTHRLLPFSLAELKQLNASFELEKLISHGGFPEPYLATDTLEANRWRL